LSANLGFWRVFFVPRQGRTQDLTTQALAKDNIPCPGQNASPPKAHSPTDMQSHLKESENLFFLRSLFAGTKKTPQSK
jgi:hypothetical protein